MIGLEKKGRRQILPVTSSIPLHFSHCPTWCTLIPSAVPFSSSFACCEERWEKHKSHVESLWPWVYSNQSLWCGGLSGPLMFMHATSPLQEGGGGGGDIIIPCQDLVWLGGQNHWAKMRSYLFSLKIPREVEPVFGGVPCKATLTLLVWWLVGCNWDWLIWFRSYLLWLELSLPCLSIKALLKHPDDLCILYVIFICNLKRKKKQQEQNSKILMFEFGSQFNIIKK